jgi:hypothetical protein
MDCFGKRKSWVIKLRELLAGGSAGIVPPRALLGKGNTSRISAIGSASSADARRIGTAEPPVAGAPALTEIAEELELELDELDEPAFISK